MVVKMGYIYYFIIKAMPVKQSPPPTKKRGYGMLN